MKGDHMPVGDCMKAMSKTRHKVASSPTSPYSKVNPSTSFRPGQWLHPQMACEQSGPATWRPWRDVVIPASRIDGTSRYRHDRWRLHYRA